MSNAILDNATAQAHSPRAGWPAVVSVTIGIFSIVTTEILPIGLLRPIGSTFHISDGTAGLMMTVPGFLAAAAAPTVTVMTARVDRRLMLCGLMLVLAVADLLAVVAPDYWVMELSRVLVGLVIGAFWSISAGLAARLVRAERVPTATTVIFSAVPLGSVLGVPVGTFIGEVAGWRAAFATLGVLTTIVFGALMAFIPALPTVVATRIGVLRALLRRAPTRLALVVTFLIVLAHFGTYTYVTPFLRATSRVSPGMIATFLLIYGVAGLVGNVLGGIAVARHRRATFAAAGALLGAATLLLPLVGHHSGAVVVGLLIAWGLAYGAVPVCSQTWFLTAAPDASEAASVLFTSSFQATISTGALLGGAVLDATSPSTVLLLGGGTAFLMTAVVWTPGRSRLPG